MKCEYPIEHLIPHRGAMCLINQVLDWGEDWCEVEVRVSDSQVFIQDGFVPAYVAIEYMAQSIAALAGLRSKAKDQPIRLGLLLGTRLFTGQADKLSVDAVLKVHVKELFNEGSGLAVFECTVTGDGMCFKANLNVYQTNDIGELLSG